MAAAGLRSTYLHNPTDCVVRQKNRIDPIRAYSVRRHLKVSAGLPEQIFHALLGGRAGPGGEEELAVAGKPEKASQGQQPSPKGQGPMLRRQLFSILALLQMSKFLPRQVTHRHIK
jgi:hypothetical protein